MGSRTAFSGNSETNLKEPVLLGHNLSAFSTKIKVNIAKKNQNARILDGAAESSVDVVLWSMRYA